MLGRSRRDQSADHTARAHVRSMQRAVLRTGVAPLVALDAVRTALSFIAVLLLRFDGSVPEVHWSRFGRFLPIAIAIQLLANWRFRLYEQVWRHASVDEAVRVIGASGVTLLALVVLDTFDPPRVPISVVVFGVVLASMVTGVSRFQTRLLAALNRNRKATPQTRVAVIGSDDSAAMVIRALRADMSAGAMAPVAVLSDEPGDLGRSLLGVPVSGTIEDLAHLTATNDLSYALLALPNPSRSAVRRAADAAEAAGIALKIVPDLSDVLANGRVARAIRDVRIEDLLGREQIRTDLDAVMQIIAGRRVLITGAGGSIGSEIARQVSAFGPAELVLVDHDETHLFETAATLHGKCIQVLADIREANVVDDVFTRHRPEVLFHAAAHKHVPILELHPCEAVRTNVQGSGRVLHAAARIGVERLVFISTDKAVDPSSVMGASKWLGERLVRMHAPSGAAWCAVRFGNVLGSRGSVIPTFNRQIEAGGPVTVTDPAMTRYFMSTEEAVQLVLQASALTLGTDVFMLDMGEPVNILDLARKMIRLSGYTPGTDIPIVITGARPGEKLEEQLSWSEERSSPTAHESIRRLHSREIDNDELRATVEKLAALASEGNDDAAAALLVEYPRHAMIAADPHTGRGSWSPAST
jgi:FlaA1/EpsC-like NDP-sugar epimerase